MKKVISFSLYNDYGKYTIGMLCNVELAKIIYPDWCCWIYYDDTVPQYIIDKLKEYDNVELFFVDTNINKSFPMMWRFTAIDNDEVGIMICRDADSRLSYREKSCVDIFENSDYLLHSIRDNPSHNDIMGGMWGIKKNDKVKITDLLIDCYGYDCDQKLLRENLVPYFSDSYLIHCSTYLHNFPTEKENEFFVGGWWYEDNFGKPYNYIFF